MNSTDGKRFLELVTMLGEVYDKPVSKERLTIWFKVLSDYSIEEVERAAIAHMRESRFMPTPADLIDRMRPNLADTAELAWVEVPKLLRNSRAAKSSDPITEKVIQDMGGWSTLGQKSSAELVWVQKAFVDRYQVYASHGVDVADRVRLERPELHLIEGRESA